MKRALNRLLVSVLPYEESWISQSDNYYILAKIGMIAVLPNISKSVKIVLSEYEGSFALMLVAFKGNSALMEKNKLKLRFSIFFRNCAKKISANAQLLVLLLSVFVFLSIVMCVSVISKTGGIKVNLDNFEVGTVADRDITLSSDLIYIDEEATAIRREARMNLVTAVFEYVPDLGERSSGQLRFFDFLSSLEAVSSSSSSAATKALEMQDLYPGSVSSDELESFFALSENDRIEVARFSSYFFNAVAARGLASFPDRGMENFSKTEVELIRNGEHSTVDKSTLLTREGLESFLDSEARSAGLDPALESYVFAFVSPFLRENLIYKALESERKLAIAVDSVSPVLVVIPQGEQIVRRGFIVTEENYSRLVHLAESGTSINISHLVAEELLLFATIVISVFILYACKCTMLSLLRYRVFLSISFCIVYTLGVVLTHVHYMQTAANFMVAVPAAFFPMLIVILLNKTVAIDMVFTMAAAVFASSGFMAEPMLFAVFSGIAAVGVTRDTGRRFDLVRSAGLMFILCPIIATIIFIMYPIQPSRMLFYTAIAACNGFLSGILVIGILPLLENLLNAVTSFRLMELSDLNTPLMQKMLLTVPGTYNHSQMVASLSEDACRAIGANSLLARVGAFYHDIGKMDQGEYFVENQHGENKHEELPPRVSATIIRSHVKQGLEKARNLKLPEEVTAFISEHHGNSLISYFYNKAKLENPDTSPEDFMYPGNPPKTRESAVVMLADTVEAACRTLEKPTPQRLEKFIDELVKTKIEHGQLNDCDLTFRDLDTIKKSFVNLLAGYYHSRIEYPNQKDPDGAGKKKSASSAKASPDSEKGNLEQALPLEAEAETKTTAKRRAKAEEETLVSDVSSGAEQAAE